MSRRPRPGPRRSRPLSASSPSEPGAVTDGPGSAIEDVLRQPVPLRPASGAVVILDEDGRVAAAHLLRPPLRDGAGHVRPQGPGVLAVRLEAEDRLEHFAWGVVPEIAADLDRKGGDVEAELAERAEMLRHAGGVGATGSGCRRPRAACLDPPGPGELT